MLSQSPQANFPQTLISGVDEVGRGCLAGPLISVATLFKSWETGCSEIDDSKKLSPKKRISVFQDILKSRELLEFGIGEVTVEEINQLGIDQANIISFDRAIKSLPTRPHFLVVDGIKGPPGFYPQEMLVVPKADGIYPVVGAASILAKVIRDALMDELHQDYPNYAWNNNKGYGSKDHISSIRKFGASEHHRTRFIREFVQTQLRLTI